MKFMILLESEFWLKMLEIAMQHWAQFMPGGTRFQEDLKIT